MNNSSVRREGIARELVDDDAVIGELVERVTFEPPEGLAGLLLSRSRIESSLETSFAFRHRRLRELLEGE